MNIPEKVNARWIAELGDEQLMSVEAELHAVFQRQEVTEKKRSGARYMLLQGPPTLVSAWHRWLLASNETQSRGLIARRRVASRP
jgi:hypothetical protein